MQSIRTPKEQLSQKSSGALCAKPQRLSNQGIKHCKRYDTTQGGGVNVLPTPRGMRILPDSEAIR